MPKHFITYNNGYWYEAWYESQSDGKRKLRKKPIHDEFGNSVRDRYQAYMIFTNRKELSTNNSKTTIDEFMPTFEQYLKDKQKKGSTIALYKRDVEGTKNFLPFYMQNANLAAIEEYLGKLNQSPASKSRIATSLKRFFSVAKIKGLITKNPLDGYEAVRYKPVVNPYTENQILSLIDSAKELDKVFPQDKGRNEAFILFALQNGLRENEYMHLRWKWLNLKDRTYNICIDEEFRPKHDHERIIHIPKLSFDFINKLPRDSDYIFPNSLGRKDWHLQDHRLKNILKGAGLIGDGHDFHQIRKTCASYRLACGEPMQNLKAHLGHQSLKELEAYVGKVVNPSEEIRKLFGVDTK